MKLITNQKFYRVYRDLGSRRLFPVSDELRETIKEKLGQIRNWRSFCDELGIRYMNMVNLKGGMVKYISTTAIELCDALEIDLLDHYPQQLEEWKIQEEAKLKLEALSRKINEQEQTL